MALINASSFLLVEDQTVIGHSKSTIFNLSLDLNETTTKESGGWKEFLACIRGGSISSSGLTDYTDGLNLKQFTNFIVNKERKTFYFRDPNSVTGTIYRGEGFVTSADEVGEHETVSEFNVEIQLDGIITVGNQRNWENIFDVWESIALNWENL